MRSRRKAWRAYTVRSECLDRLLMPNRRDLEHVLSVYVEHHNTGRRHRAVGLIPPDPRARPLGIAGHEVMRRDRLGGLVHEYYRAVG
jgi:hypothetical protein